jgi:hypothetical protein
VIGEFVEGVIEFFFDLLPRPIRIGCGTAALLLIVALLIRLWAGR